MTDSAPKLTKKSTSDPLTFVALFSETMPTMTGGC